MARLKKYSPEFREEAVKRVIESQRPIAHIAREIDVNSETLRSWVRRYQSENAGEEKGLDLNDRARLRELERRNAELERENSFLKKGVPRMRKAA